MKQIRFNNYLSEVSSEILREVELNSFTILKAPTGAGKSYAILNEVMQKLPSALFLCPTRVLVDNLTTDYPKGYGYEWADTNRLTSKLVTTYDTGKILLEGLERYYNTVFIDEAHLLAGHSEFRLETLGFLAQLREMKGVNVVLITATPEVIELIEGVHLVDCKRIGKQKKRIVNLIRTNETAKDKLFNLISNRDKSKLTIIRHNHKDLIDEVTEANSNVNIARLYSDSDGVLQVRQTAEVVQSIKKGVIPKEVDVLLTTSVIDAGLSLSVNREVNIYAVPNDQANLIHPIDIVQLTARIRDNSSHSSSIDVFYRDFEDYEIPTQTISFKGKQLINEIGNNWRYYECLDHSSYLGVLSYYNLYPVELNELGCDIDFNEVSKPLRDISIYRRLSKYPSVWCMLQAEFSNDLDWLDGCNGDGRKGHSEIKATRIANQLVDAYKVLLHPDIFVDSKKYNFKRAENLINAHKEINRKGNSTLKEVLISLLESYRSTEVGRKISFDRSQYSELDNNAKKIANEFCRLLFNGRLNARNMLVRRELNNKEQMYISGF